MEKWGEGGGWGGGGGRDKVGRGCGRWGDGGCGGWGVGKRCGEGVEGAFWMGYKQVQVA